MSNWDVNIEILIRKYTNGTLSNSEAVYLAEWVKSSKQNAERFRTTVRAIEQLESQRTAQAENFSKRVINKAFKKEVPRKVALLPQLKNRWQIAAISSMVAVVAIVLGFSISYNNANNADIYYKAHKALGDTPAVGGVVGVTAASISHCYNYGIVSAAYALDSILTDKNTPIVGGVVGECDIDGITLSNLINGDGSANKGKVLLCSYNVTYATYGGGIVGKGYSGGDDNATNNTVKDCTNSGKVAITTTEKTKVYLGGICGGGPNITNCTNNGEVTFWDAYVQESGIGGIAGNLAGNLNGNYSFGKVSIRTLSTKTRVGGLVGRCNVADLTFDNCAVSANIGTASGCKNNTNNVGMICGLVNKAVNSGTIYVFGTRTWNGTGTELTAENYMDYIDGSNNGKLNALTVVFEDKKPKQ